MRELATGSEREVDGERAPPRAQTIAPFESGVKPKWPPHASRAGSTPLLSHLP